MGKHVIALVGMMIFVLYCPYVEGAIHIPNTDIQAFASYSYTAGTGPERTLDDILESYWVGTDDLQVGDSDIIAYHFNNPYQITQIDFISLPQHDPHYFMGELDIRISQNTTDGFNGDWATVDHIDGDFNPGGISFTRYQDTQYTSWVSLYMEYQGTGAWGPASPAFYLNEIDFYGSPVPLPPSALLFASGLVVWAGLRKRFKK